MSTSTSTTVEMTPRGHKKTTTTITFTNEPGQGWVEQSKTVVIEEVEETGPLLAPTWAQPKHEQHPPFVPHSPYPNLQPPPSTPWGAPTIWA
jgi:hypothetical protein